MLFGDPITIEMLVPGGVLLVLILVFQVLTGKRVIRFKGRTHVRVHRLAAYAMLLVAAGHGLLGLAMSNDWSIG